MEGKPVITVKRPEKPDLVEIIDSDEEGDDVPLSGDEKCKFSFIVFHFKYKFFLNNKILGEEYEPLKDITSFLNFDYGAMFDRFADKYDIQKQYDLSLEVFDKKLTENDGKFKKL